MLYPPNVSTVFILPRSTHLEHCTVETEDRESPVSSAAHGCLPRPFDRHIHRVPSLFLFSLDAFGKIDVEQASAQNRMPCSLSVRASRCEI